MAIEVKDKEKTKEQLINELVNLRQQNSLFEKSKAERKVLQETRIRKKTMGVIESVARGLGHELRNPLAAIKLVGYFLNMSLKNPESETKEALEILERNVAKSEKIIVSLLLFVNQKEPFWQKTDVNEVLKKTLSCTGVVENVEIICKLMEKLPTLLADPEQLSHVFENLIFNAVQAMPKGGRLLVKTEAPMQDCVVVSFADTGVGISKKVLQKLFDPLFTTQAKAIGLGLAITQILVENHGGRIEVESEVGKGSVFKVSLPVSLESKCQKQVTVDQV